MIYIIYIEYNFDISHNPFSCESQVLILVMPAYDVSLWDFLKYASTQTKQKDQDEEFFPLSERIEMTKRICDGLLYMNKEKSIAHRDIKLRSVFTLFRPFFSIKI